MKRILNLLVVGATFYVGMNYFPEFISIDSTQTLIATSVLMVIFASLEAGILSLIVKSLQNMVDRGETTAGGMIGCFSLVVFLLLAFLITPIRLWILEAMFDGFRINGFWTYILLSVMFAVFSANKKKD